jgi:hypothetical protein
MPTSIERSFPGTASVRFSYGHCAARALPTRSATAMGMADNNPQLKNSQEAWLLLQQICSGQLIDIVGKFLILLINPEFPVPLNHSDCPSVKSSLRIWRN